MPSGDVTWVLVVASSAFGLTVGSFLNVVLYRVPRGRSISTPRSACPSCGHLLAWWENIPVLSWLVLRGRCRGCRTHISLHYPAVELTTGLVFGWIAAECHAALVIGAYCSLAAAMLVVVLIEPTEHDRSLRVAEIGTLAALLLFMGEGLAQSHWGGLIGSASGAAMGWCTGAALRRLGPTRDGQGQPAALLLAGCWLGGLPLASLATAGAAAAAGMVTCLAVSRMSTRPAVRASAGSVDMRLHPMSVPVPLVLGVSMAAAFLVQNRWW